MSETREALHEILEFAANTTSAMGIMVDCYAGSVQTITTTIAPTEERTDKEDLIKKLDLALNQICLLDNWFEEVGYKNCPAHKRLIDVMANVALALKDLKEEA